MNMLVTSKTRKYGESSSMAGGLTNAAEGLAVEHKISLSDFVRQDLPTRQIMSKLALVVFGIHSGRF